MWLPVLPILCIICCPAALGAKVAARPAIKSPKPERRSFYEGLPYLGTFVHPETEKETAAKRTPSGRQASLQKPASSDYFCSVEEETWPAAKELCGKVANGHLVRIETAEEDKAVHDLIRSDKVRKVGELIWTDGITDRYEDSFWNSIDEQLTYKNFDVEPGASAYIAFRSLSERGPTDYKWRAIYDGQERHYYLCEVETNLPNSGNNVPTPPNNTAVTCQGTNDLVLLLDASGGLQPDEYLLETLFLGKLAGAFPPPNHVSFVTYAEEIQVRIPLNNRLTPEQMQKEIWTHVRKDGYTFTAGGIEESIAEIESNGRPGVPHKIVVFTDGQSNAWRRPDGKLEFPDEAKANEATATAVEKAKEKGIIMFTAGITSRDALKDTNGVGWVDNLLMIAGGVKENQFGVQDTDGLSGRIRDISTKICSS